MVGNFIPTTKLQYWQAAVLFWMLNPGKVQLKVPAECMKMLPVQVQVNMSECKFVAQLVIYTDVEPSELNYPEGWYYCCGQLRCNDRKNGGYVTMLKHDGTPWSKLANYHVLPDEE